MRMMAASHILRQFVHVLRNERYASARCSTRMNGRGRAGLVWGCNRVRGQQAQQQWRKVLDVFKSA